MDHAVDHTLDMRGTVHPVALLRISRAFKEMTGGQTLEVLVDDPETWQDLFKVLGRDQYELIEIMEKDTGRRAVVKKRGARS